jgi:hypothetical protein
MLKFSPIFKMNGAYLVGKKDVKKKRLSILKVWVLQTCKNIFDLCQALSMSTLQLMENIPKTLWQYKVLCFTCDLSNIQKYS